MKPETPATTLALAIVKTEEFLNALWKTVLLLDEMEKSDRFVPPPRMVTVVPPGITAMADRKVLDLNAVAAAEAIENAARLDTRVFIVEDALAKT